MRETQKTNALSKMADVLTLNTILSTRQKRMLSEGRVSYGRLPGKAQ